jgi:hypothetical protein
MTNAHMSRTAAMKALFALIVVAAIAWQIPFTTTAQSEEGEKSEAVAPLSVTCDVSPNPAETDQQVTWRAHPVGGNTYFYEWTGDGNFPGNQSGANFQNVNATYGQAGPKHAHVKVTSGQQIAEADCTTLQVTDPTPNPLPLSVTCSASPNPQSPNAPVVWSAQVTNGTSQDHFTWTGEPNFPGNQSGVGLSSVTQSYANPGPKNAHVVVNSSDNRTAEASCSVQISNAAPTCNRAADLSATNISASGNQVTTTITNSSASCTYNVTMVSYKTGDWDFNPATRDQFLQNQEVFDSETTTLAPGQSRTVSVNIPSCNYQVDVLQYNDGADPVPDNGLVIDNGHGNQYWLFEFDVQLGRGSCFPPNSQCVPNRAAHLQATDVVVNAQGRAVSTVSNISTFCSYNVSMVSYQVSDWDFNPATRDEFLENQVVFDSDVHPDLGPGQSVTLSVALPQCNYQVDVLEWEDGADPVPDNGLILDQGHGNQYWLLKFLVELDGESCFDVPECPAQPTITSQNPSGSFSVGQLFSYTVTTSGGVPPISVSINPVGAPVPGLTINGSTLSGTIGAGASGTYTYEVTARSANSPLTCATTQTFTITIQPPQCPAAPVFTSVPPTTAAIGTPFSYTAVTSGGVAPITISIASLNPAPGLTISGATVSGTPTTPGTYTYTVTARSAGTNDPLCNVLQTFTITIPPVVQCPVAPVFTSVPPVVTNVPPGTAYSYTVTTSGGVAPVTVLITPINAAPGLVINGSTLSGTLTTSGTFSYSAKAFSAGSPTTLDCGIEQIINISVATVNECPASAIPTITSVPPVVDDVDTGTDYSYTVTTSGGIAPITVTITPINAAPGLTINGNTLSGEFEKEGNFSYSVTAQSTGVPKSCAATQTITMSVDNGGGGCESNCGGGGGGSRRRRPNVVLFSEPEVAGASISLAQVPYTGLGTSLLQVFLFIVGLLAISAGIVYGITRKLRRNAEATLAYAVPTAGAASSMQNMSAASVEPEFDPYVEYVHATATAPRQTTPSYEPAPQAPRAIEPQFGTAPFKTATAPAPAALESVSMPITSERPAPMAAAPARTQSNDMPRSLEVKEIDPARIQNEARASRTLVSDDGAALIAHSAEGDEKRALERLSQVVEIAKTRYPREDGWLILDKDRVREALFISTLSMIPLFVEWIVRAEDKKVFTFLRMLKHQEQPVGDFMRKVVSELDTAHRARLEGVEERQLANAHIAEVTYHLSNKEFEAIVAELLHGVDERYDSAYTSVRLSLVRVLDMIKERSLRAVGTAYAYAPEQEIAA